MNNSIVYIVAPAQFATGGPELLHQLGKRLRDAGLDARMHYLPADHPAPVHDNYKEYELPYERHIEDAPEHWMIAPEIYTSTLFQFKKLRKAVWWLSVDNYFWHLPGWRFVNYAMFRFWGKQRYWGFDARLRKLELHLVQSAYAADVLRQKGIQQPLFVSDYLHQQFLGIQTDLSKKENLVAYNPKKGKHFTQKLIAHLPDIQFVRLEGLSRQEMVAALQACKIYIDFGQHPGKDRIPREAAVLGCCVLVNRKGSAAYAADLPFDEQYKLPEQPTVVGQQIRAVLADYKLHQANFAAYVADIQQQESRFEKEVQALIDRLQA